MNTTPTIRQHQQTRSTPGWGRGRRLAAVMASAAALATSAITAPVATAVDGPSPEVAPFYQPCEYSKCPGGQAYWPKQWLSDGTVTVTYQPRIVRDLAGPLTFGGGVVTDGMQINPITGQWTFSIDGAATPKMTYYDTTIHLFGSATFTTPGGQRSVRLHSFRLIPGQHITSLLADVDVRRPDGTWEPHPNQTLIGGKWEHNTIVGSELSTFDTYIASLLPWKELGLVESVDWQVSPIQLHAHDRAEHQKATGAPLPPWNPVTGALTGLSSDPAATFQWFSS